jgi:CheY-like chemotaxis protein
MHAVEMIEEAFEVVEAASSDEAIAILEARLDITVVFTDVQMPAAWMDSSLRLRFGTASDQDRGHVGPSQT